MRIEGIDKRARTRERHGANFLVFIYESGNPTNTSWSVDSYLMTDSTLDDVLRWLRENLPSPHAQAAARGPRTGVGSAEPHHGAGWTRR